MTLTLAILQDPTLQLIALVAIAAALADLLVAVTAAIARKDFDLAVVADFLATHVLARVIPIVGLAFLASALDHGTASMVDVPAALRALVATTWAAALAGVIAYAAETFASLRQSVSSPKEP